MAVFLIRARSVVGGIPVPYPGDQFFTDEPSSDPYYAFIQNMKAQGITVGCSPTTYCPTAPFTRGQMAVFIIRGFFAP